VVATRPWILAIDFGTSYTVAAARVEGREPEVIEIGGERRIPSVVLVDADRIIVGRVADELASANPAATLRAPKSRLGDQVPVVLGGRPYQVVDLVSAQLAHVYEEATRQMGGPPDAVKLTHPAGWNRPWLNRLLDAARRAGIGEATLVPEPVAAALTFASEVGVDDGDHIAVYDLGGGTFDTAVVASDGDGFRVVGRPGGDNTIGGELFDEILLNHIGAELPAEAWQALQVGADATWMQVAANLRKEARRAKEMLSAHPYADALVALPDGIRTVRIAQATYETLITPYIEETITLLDRCIANAGLRPDQLVAISLVGGASRTPLVERFAAEAFPGVPISRRGDPKTSTAMGAVRASGTNDAAIGLAGWATDPSAGAAPAAPAAPAAAAAATEITPAGPSTIGPPTMQSPPRVEPPARPPVAAPAAYAAPAAPPAFTPYPPVHAAPAAPAPTRRRRRGGRIMLGLLVVAAGAGVAAFALLRSADGTAGRSTATAEEEITDGTVRPLSTTALRNRLLEPDQVSDAIGQPIAEVQPGNRVVTWCGRDLLPATSYASRTFEETVGDRRVLVSLTRYDSVPDAEAAFAEWASFGADCPEPSVLSGGQVLTFRLTPLETDDPGGTAAYAVDYSADGTTVTATEFFAATVQGANISIESLVVLGRVADEFDAADFFNLVLEATAKAARG